MKLRGIALGMAAGISVVWLAIAAPVVLEAIAVLAALTFAVWRLRRGL